MQLKLAIRIHCRHVFSQSRDLWHGYLPHGESLAVEIGRVHVIRVHQHEPPEPGAHQMHGAVGPQAAAPGDAHGDPLKEPEPFFAQVDRYAALGGVHTAPLPPKIGSQSLNTGW